MQRRREETSTFKRKLKSLLRKTKNKKEREKLEKDLKIAQETLEVDGDLDPKYKDHFIGRLSTGEFHLDGQTGNILVKYNKDKDAKGYYVEYTDITNHQFLNKASVILGALIGLYSRDIISEDVFLREVDSLYDEFGDQTTELDDEDLD